MEDLFFNPTYTNFGQLIGKLLLFVAISLVVLYIIFFIFSKILYRKSTFRKEVVLRLTFLWSLFLFLNLYNVYFFFLIYKIGINNIDVTFLGLLPQIFVHLGTIILFFNRCRVLKNLIKINNLN